MPKKLKAMVIEESWLDSEEARIVKKSNLITKDMEYIFIDGEIDSFYKLRKSKDIKEVFQNYLSQTAKDALDIAKDKTGYSYRVKPIFD